MASQSIRKARIAELSGQGRTISEIVTSLASEGIVNPRTGKGYSAATVGRDLQVISEVIGDYSTLGRTQETVVQNNLEIPLPPVGKVKSVSSTPFWPERYTYDSKRTDYIFWDRFRRGEAHGLEFAGMLADPTTHLLASFVVGDGPTITLQEASKADTNGTKPSNDDPIKRTNDLIAVWLRSINGTLLDLASDEYALGDQFPFMNTDGSLSIPDPASVKVEYDALDYRNIISYTIVTKLDNGRVEDKYTVDTRTITTTTYESHISIVTRDEYPNVMGTLTAVHFACDRSGNELFGRPKYAGSYHMFARFNTLLEKFLDGAELHGTPIPVFYGLENIDETIEANRPETTNPLAEDEDDARTSISYDRNNAIFLGKGGNYGMMAPGIGFTKDILVALQYLLFLFCLHVNVPEFLFGGMGDSGNRSLTDNQFKVFSQHIKRMRKQFEGTIARPVDDAKDAGDSVVKGGLLQLAELYLRSQKLTKPWVVVGPLEIKWPLMTLEEAQVTLQKVIYAYSQQALTPVAMLTALDLVTDPDEQIAEAKTYWDKHMADLLKQQAAGGDFQKAINMAAYQDTTPSTGADPTQNTAMENPGGGQPAQLTVQRRKAASTA